ncbi:hypothetical protein OG21DRAFT_1489687 [Imleria badia]|nr:hypothetical protein OG21DRAFT_1489687 [Imleria badia]
MNEIDAALNFRNVSIVANYIKDRTKNVQFIIIETENATQSITIDNHVLVPTKTVMPVTTSTT